MDFKGKTAVITGGASGIGFATAAALGRRGMNLVIADIEQGALDTAKGELERTGVKVAVQRCDVSKRDEVAALADMAFGDFGGVHVVFNNAGVAVGGPIAEMKHSDWKWIIDVDLWGPIHGTELFLQRMLDQDEDGHMLYTASFAGLAPNKGLGPYCVAKYGVVAMAEVLQKELRGTKLGVSVFCPMRIATNIEKSQRNRPQDLGGPDASPPVLDQGEGNQDLAGRVLKVEDMGERVAAAVGTDQLYILSHPESRTPVQRRFARIEKAFDALGDG
ncbi:SDR family NAD(P)-dependent oxidoreductase [Marinibaculum pumilum]|uniref:SDR family NAD(P)-dependent oxidoreductase n=1 Tax=Marinibaculum pumilum TaxID=1766165 RepID=A0ABV7L955_9PROT